MIPRLMLPYHETREESREREVRTATYYVRREDWWGLLVALRFNGNAKEVIQSACERMGCRSGWAFDRITVTVQRKREP